MKNPPPLPKWSQPALIPIHYPLITLTNSWSIPADSTATMVAYTVEGLTTHHTMLAKGIEWCLDIHNENQRAEIFHDLTRIALEHLSPF